MHACDEQRFKDAKHTAGGQRPSMGQDMQKGRRTEIDFINGVIAGKGREVGVPTPSHVKLIDAVKRVEHGQIPAKPENLYGI